MIRKVDNAPPAPQPTERTEPGRAAAAAPSVAGAPQPPGRPAPPATTAPARSVPAATTAPAAATAAGASQRPSDDERFDLGALEGMTMADLLGPDPGRSRSGDRKPASTAAQAAVSRTVDDFDFDEEAFLAALDENEPVGTTGEVVSGTVVSVESDGVYVDIGGKAPGFMPKKEAGLGVITNLKERFPRGLQLDVLVTREQNADGMVTISARALALRQSWEKLRQLEKEGKVVQVQINGFNRGGVTCDLEGLRGFIPRSQLQDGENHEALVGKSLGVTFLEVNPETRKLVLSERKAATAARFAELEVGQLVEGQVAALKPYGFFIDLGGVSGLLHHSSITGGALRDLREAFEPGERIKALITELDPGRGRIALNTALLEGQPGEILIAKATVMAEASDRANRAKSLLRQREQDAG
jgi:small subunit ribosomal protein S1